MNTESVLYLDHNATTPCDPRVLEEMQPYYSEQFWNPSSSHILGRRASHVLDEARERVARSCGVAFEDVIFTSGATEGCQIALERLPLGVLKESGLRASPVEHRAVRNALDRIRGSGVPLQGLSTIHGGLVDPGTINEPHVYVVQAANSESGVIQNLAEIGHAVRAAGGLLVCDAAQALWKLPLAKVIPFVDVAILSGHKAYGPKGVGVVIAKSAYRRLLRASGLQGGQEHGIREGTVNLPGAVGLAAAVAFAEAEGPSWRDRARRTRDDFERAVTELSGGAIYPHFSNLPRLPNTSSLRVSSVPADLLVTTLTTIAVSYGSACSSGAPEPSTALVASGISREVAAETIRVSFGREGDSTLGSVAAELLYSSYQGAVRTEGMSKLR